jgi:hypothetical protein
MPVKGSADSRPDCRLSVKDVGNALDSIIRPPVGQATNSPENYEKFTQADTD